MATCAGWRLGFSDLIVQLTAVHFHYAGFAAPVICGLAGRGIEPRRPLLRRLYQLTCWTVMLAVWIVAIGFVISPLAQLAGAVLLAAGMTLLAVFLCFVLPRRSGRLAGALLVVAGLSLALPMALAVAYAAGELGAGPGLTIPEMARWHGLFNAFGFAGAGLAAFALWCPPSCCAAPHPPFSRLAGGWRIGADFFDREGLVDPAGHPTGLVDDLDAYRRDGFDPTRVHPEVRRFYERTIDFDLHVEARWRFGFRLAGRLFRRLTNAVGQLNVPLGRLDESQMESRLVALADDGRRAVRAWVRSYAATGRPVFVAAYSMHESAGVPNMNIALPLPGGNLAGLLRMDPIAGCPGSLSLTTLPEEGRIGDEGVYFANRVLPIRLPLDETLRIWPRDEAPAELSSRFDESPANAVFARHDLWLAGLRYLTIDYLLIPRQEPETRVEAFADA